MDTARGELLDNQTSSALHLYLEAPDWDSAKRIVTENWKVLSSDQVLVEFVRIAAPFETDKVANDALKSYIGLLSACERVGIDAAFDEWLSVPRLKLPLSLLLAQAKARTDEEFRDVTEQMRSAFIRSGVPLSELEAPVVSAEAEAVVKYLNLKSLDQIVQMIEAQGTLLDSLEASTAIAMLIDQTERMDSFNTAVHIEIKWQVYLETKTANGARTFDQILEPPAAVEDEFSAARASVEAIEDNDTQAFESAARRLKKLRARSDVASAHSGFRGWLVVQEAMLYRRHAGAVESRDEIEQAIHLYGDAIGLLSGVAREFANAHLGDALRVKAGLIGRDASEAVETLRSVVLKAPSGSRRRVSWLILLGDALSESHAQHSKEETLEEASTCYGEALRGLLSHTDANYLVVMKLADTWQKQYQSSGRIETLDRAIQLLKAALESVGQDSPYRHLLLGRLTAVERVREEKPDPNKSADRIASMREAVAKSGPADRYAHLSNLGILLADQYKDSGDPQSYDEAMKAYEEALALGGPGNQFRPMILCNIGNLINEGVKRDRPGSKIEDAIGHLAEATQKVPLGSPYCAIIRNTYGVSLRIAFDQTRDDLFVKRANRAYASAAFAAEYTENTTMAMRIVHNWGDWAFDREDWGQAEEAYLYGLSAMYKQLATQSLVANQELIITKAEGFPLRAAYSIASMGDARGAVETVERYRALVLSEKLEITRRGISKIADHEPELMTRFQEVSRAREILNKRLTTSELAGAFGNELQRVSDELDEVLNAIRAKPGFEDFQLLPVISEIKACASDSSIVYLLVTSAGGLALVVGGLPNDDVKAVWLGSIFEESLRCKCSDYLIAYQDRHRNSNAWDRTLEEIGQWLWQTIMAPLVDVLREGCPIVFVPCGLLGLLPLHAAWTSNESDHSVRFVSDMFPISYSPNARSVAAARKLINDIMPDSTVSMLAIEQPTPSSQHDLRFASTEVAAALAFFPETRLLRHTDASKAQLISNLGNFYAAHFCCHAVADLRSPLEGGMSMSEDAMFTLRECLSIPRRAARLAVLSACETGIPGLVLPDEVVSLSAGLLNAGFAGIISSLWSVNDASTALFMVKFYDSWRVGGMKPINALRETQRWMRSENNANKTAYLDKFLTHEVPARLREAAEELVVMLLLEPPNEILFHEVRHWAAFTMLGV
jgi:CHAT domain-containing protein/tetratricopeptide (TPR) repeat protein